MNERDVVGVGGVDEAGIYFDPVDRERDPLTGSQIAGTEPDPPAVLLPRTNFLRVLFVETMGRGEHPVIADVGAAAAVGLVPLRPALALLIGIDVAGVDLRLPRSAAKEC